MLAIGVFDGVHLGHQAVIRLAVERARSLGLPAAVFTFVEHPRSVLRPDQAVPLLTTWREKRERISLLGVRQVIGAHFTPELSCLPAEEFVRDLLVAHLRAAHVVVGYNFRFGHGAQGTPELLRCLSVELGFGLDVLPPYMRAGAAVSSTEIRRLLGEGRLDAAHELLGYPYLVSGQVVGGDQRGRRIGFPTANLHVEDRKLLPSRGVYAGRAHFPAEERPCVVNIGVRPTFASPQLKVEAHVLDFSGDLYGQQVALSLEHHLRSERAFGSVDELVSQIDADVRKARNLLNLARPVVSEVP